MKNILFVIIAFNICIYAASIEDGVTWLIANQQLNGSWGDPQKLGFLETTEVLNTFITLSETTGVEKALNYFENQFPENTDFWARKLSLFARSNRDFYFLLQQLQSRKNADGGFGFSRQYQSTIWETMLSLEALKNAGLNINELYPTINFILINQNSNGGFGFFAGESSRTLSTAYCTYILSDFRGVSGVDPAINRSVEWLLQKQNPDSGFGDGGSTVYETAITWLALRSVDMGSEVRKNAFQYVASRQDQNGSWNNSIHNTALALRVIQEGLRPNLYTNDELISFTPQQPNKGDTVLISAKIVNNGDGESPSSAVQISYGTTEIGVVNIPTVQPQDTTTAEINWSTAGIAGYQTITVNIDPENLIKELNEDDNTASKQIFIQDTMPPETLNIWVSNPYFSPNNDGVKDYTRTYFTASEDVTVDILVRDYYFNIIKTVILNEFYSPGRYSVIWDGTTDEGIIAKDGDYLFEVRLKDTGNNLEIRNAFVCVDCNKTTIFASLDPNRIKSEKVFEGQVFGSKYYPETDQFFYTTVDTLGCYYLVMSNAKRESFFTLDSSLSGFSYLSLSPDQKLYYFKSSNVYCYDLMEHTKIQVLSDTCAFFTISPDGNKIAYLKPYSWTYYKLYLVNIDGSSSISVDTVDFDPYSNYTQIAWSPDGQWLFYVNYVGNDTMAIQGIWRANRSGTQTTCIYETTTDYLTHLYFVPSNSGSKIAIIRMWWGDYSGETADIWLINSDGTDLEFLIQAPPPPPQHHVANIVGRLLWHPDDSEILVAWMVYPNGGYEPRGTDRINISTKEVFHVFSFTPYYYSWYNADGLPGITYCENGKRLVYLYDYTGTCDRYGENCDTILDFCVEGPLMFTKDYCAMLPDQFSYCYSLNNLTIEITGLSRLAQTPDMLTIMGTVFDRNLEKFTVEYGIGQNPGQFFSIYESNYCVNDTIITAWVPPKSGYYTIKLTGIDKAGNVLTDSKVVNWEWETVITDLRAIPDFFSPDGDGINDLTTISYYLIHPEPLNFKITNKKGQTVRSFYEYHEEPGSYSFVWDGKNDNNSVVSDGIYNIKIFGMSIPVNVDAHPPIAAISGGTSAFRPVDLKPVIYFEGIAYDPNFYRWALEYAFKDTSEFTTIMTGNNPVYKMKPGDTIPQPDTMVCFDLRDCIGKNHLRLTVEDRGGHKSTARDSINVDSLFIGCFPVLDSTNPRTIWFHPAIAMAKFSAIADIKFSFKPTDSIFADSSYIEIGHGSPYLNEPFLFTLDTVFHFSNNWIWRKNKAWLKCEVTRQNAPQYKDSILIPVIPFPDADTLFYFSITQPLEYVQHLIDYVYGLVTMKTELKVNDTLHTEYLDEVSFYYRSCSPPDTSWYKIGNTCYNPPFIVSWVSSAIPDGYYFLRADGVGAAGDYSDTIKVNVNNSRPYISFSYPPHVLQSPYTTYVKGQITLTADAHPHPIAQQNGAIIDSVVFWYRISPSSSFVRIGVDSTLPSPFTFQLNTNALADSAYLLYARCFESFGQTAADTVPMVVDNTCPVVSITSPENNAFFDNVDTIDIMGISYDKNIKKYNVSYQGADSLWLTIAEKECSVEGLLAQWDVRTIAAGFYNLRLFAIDWAGNLSDTAMITVSIENSPAPKVEITHPAVSDSFVKDTCSIIGKVEDDNLVCWVLSYGGGISPTEWTKIDSATYNFMGCFTIWDTKLLQDTIYTIKLWAIDAIGKTNEKRVAVTIDNTLPSAEITYPASEQYVGVPISIIGTASDRNFVNYKLEIGEGRVPNFWTLVKIGTTPVFGDTFCKLKPLPGMGWWSIRLTVKDKVENVSQVQVPIMIDTLPPAPPTGLALQDSFKYVTLTWHPNIEPDLVGYNAYRQNSKIEDSIPAPYYFDSVYYDGHYVYHVTAFDWFNLESDPSETVSVNIDITKPFVAIYEPQNGQRIHGAIDIIGTANDNHFKAYTIKIGPGLNPEEWTFLNQSFTPVIWGKLATWNTEGLDSIWSIKLKADDTFNNKDSTTVFVFIDNVPPSKPQGLIASTNYDTVKINWLPNPEPDLAGYRLFRDGVLVNPTSLITDTFYFDRRPDGIYSYYLVAEDLAENQSEPSDSVSAEIDVRAPHATITYPHQGDRVADTVSIQTYIEDNDTREVRFEFKPSIGPWELIGIDTLDPFTMNWVTDTLMQGTYYLKATAKDYHNNVDPSPESINVFVVKDLEPPAPPSGLAASVAHDTVYLNWQANTEPDLAGYNVYQHQNGEIIKLNSSLVTDTHFVFPPPWHDYYYFSITAVDTATNESEHSAIVKVDYASPIVWISRPADGQTIKGLVPITGTVYDENLVQYVLSYSISGNPAEWETLAVDSQNVENGVLVLWYTENLPDNFYTIKLRAVDENNNYSEHVIAVHVDHTPPAPPQNLIAELAPDSTIYLHWDPNSEPDLKGYNLYYSIVSGAGYVRLNLEIIGLNEYWIDLPGGKTYYFVATAVDLMDNESGYSNEASITPPIDDIDFAISEEDILIYPPSPVAGETALIVANVHNLGTQNATNVDCDFLIKYQDNYHYLGRITIPELPANSTIPTSINWQTSGYIGIDTVCVLVDPNDRIIETNEDNNNAFKEVIVRPSDIVFEITLDDTLYEPNTDVECQLRLINFCPEITNFLSKFSILDSLQDTLNSKYEIESFMYVDDTIPPGGIPFGDFYWDTILTYKGRKSITHTAGAGEHAYGFNDAQLHLSIQPDQAIIHYAYLSPENTPSEIMLEFQDADGSSEHRAYWGANLINRGTNNTTSRRYLGEPPQPGSWVRLVVPAETIGLAGKDVKGISYILYNGRANWDWCALGLKTFSISLDQGDSTQQELYWNTKNTSGGQYEFLASLSFDSEVVQKKEPFRIRSLPGIAVDVYTDKVQYQSQENVTITSTVSNQSPNHAYENIHENIALKDSLGAVFYDTSKTIAILLPQNFIQTEYYWNTGITPPGVYEVLDCITKDSDTLARDSAMFHITSTGGTEIRLSGVIKSVPKIVPYPDSFIIYYRVTNIGNIALDSLPIRTRIIDGETFDTLVTYLDTISLLVNETKSDTFPQVSTNFTLKPYMLTLDALIEDTVLNIAAGGFYVTDAKPPVILSISPTGIVGGIITIQSQILDDLSGVDSAFYKITGSYEVLNRTGGDSLLGIYTAQFNTTAPPDGNYHLIVKAKDKRKNQTMDSVAITIDNTPPEIAISGVTDSTYYNTDVTPIITIAELHLDSVCILLNNNPFESNTPVSQEGEYTLYVYASDLAGNETDTSIFFVVDKTAPLIDISGVADSTWYNHDVTPVITFADPHLDSTYTALNGMPFISGTTITNEDEFTLYAWAIDKAANASDTSIYFVIDKTPPEPPVMVSPPESSVVTVQPVTITGLAEINSFVTLDIAGTPYNTIANASGEFIIDSVYLNPGWNLLKFTAKDRVNNVSDTAYYHLSTDATPPVILSIAPTGLVSGAITVQAEISDDVTGVDSAFYKIVGDYTQLIRISGDSLLGIYTAQYNTTVLADGDYFIRVKAMDYAHNIAIDSVTITVDNTAPVILITGVADSTYYNTNVTPVITITDPNPDSVVMLLNGEPFISGSTITDENEYTLYVYAKDRAGNEADTALFFVIDKTNPVIEITGVSDSTYYNSDVTPVITITDTYLDTSYVTLNGNPFESGTTITDEGIYTLYVYASDFAGNTRDTSIYFVIDKTAPTIAISGVADSVWYNHDVTPVITFADPHLDSTYIALNGLPFISGTTITDEDEFTLYAWAIDKAANASDTSIYFVIDKTPPEPPIMVAPPESSTVPSSPITVDGTAEPLSIVTLNISGTLYESPANNFGQFTLENVHLNPGWNLLRFTAKDKANNVSDTSYYHLNLSVAGIELEASIYIPQKYARVLCFAKEDSNFVKSVLDSIGLWYKLVKNRCDFEEEFHSGKYNLYLIAGENCELHPYIQDEIIEMVNLGDGLVVTSRGTEHMHRFEEVFSLKFKGHIPANKIKYVAFLESPISHPDTLTISAKVVKFEVINSTLAAKFNTDNPAAVVNEYGDGKAVFFGFDMTDAETSIKRYLANAICYAAPESSLVYPGATIPVEISIKNLSPEQRLNVIEVLPSDFTIIAALDKGIISGPTITWNFLIQQNSSVYLNSIIKVPNETFTDTISAEIAYLSGGSYIPYDTIYLEISTISKKLEDLFNEVIKGVHQLFSVILSGSEESLQTDSTRTVINGIVSLLNESKNLLATDRSKSLEGLLIAVHKLSFIDVILSNSEESLRTDDSTGAVNLRTPPRSYPPSSALDEVRKKIDFLIKILLLFVPPPSSGEGSLNSGGEQ